MIADSKSEQEGLGRELRKTDGRHEEPRIPSPAPSSGLEHLAVGLRLLIMAVLIFSVIYPGFVTVAGRLLWPAQAEGTVLEVDGEPVGSQLIGQQFNSDTFFHPRPSSTGYNAMNSGSANLGPLSGALTERVTAQLAELQEQGIDPADVPVEMVTESGSSLDPHITPAGALLQVPRVSQSTGLSPATLEKLIESHTQGKFAGIFGWERVNVLLLNLDVQKRIEDSNE